MAEGGQLGLNSKSLTTCLLFPCSLLSALSDFPSLLPLLCIFLSVCLSVSCTPRSSALQSGPAFTFSHFLPLPHPLPPPWRGTDPSSVQSNPGPSPPPSSLLSPAPSSLLGRGGASLPLPPLLSLSEGGGPGEGGGVPRSACGSWRCVWWGWQGLNGGEGVPAAAPQAARAWASAASGRSASQW